MTDEIPNRCIETGEGVAVWEAMLEPEPQCAPALSQEMPDSPTYDTVTLYRPVAVEINDGDVCAYFYDRDPDMESLMDDGGKIYVEPRYVHVTPLPDAVPAYKHDAKGVDAIVKSDGGGVV